MAWSVTLAGETFTDANVAGTAYADEATGFPAILAAFAREAAFLQGLAATSSTPVAPAPGPASFVTHQDAATVGLSPGMLVRVVSVADPTRLMVGTVTGFVGTALELNVIHASGGSASDWLIARPAGGVSLVMDPAPALGADLDADGRSVAGLLNLAMSGTLTAGGTAELQGTVTVRGGMQSGATWLGSVSGEVVIRASDALHVYCTIVGDTTFLIAGGTVPGMGHDHLVHWTMGGAGGYAVGVKTANHLTNSDLTGWGTAAGGSLTVSATPGSYQSPVLPHDGMTLFSVGGTGIGYANANKGVATTAGSWTLSARAKRNGSDWLLLQFDHSGGAGFGRVFAYFNLLAGTLGSANAINGASLSAAAIGTLGDGVYECSVGGTVPAAGLTSVTAFMALAAGDGNEGGVTPGSSIRVLDAQLVPGPTPLGTIPVGASRDAAWQGKAIDFPSVPAGQRGDLGISVEPDGRLVAQDHTVTSI